MFEIKKVSFKNILSYGNELVTIDFSDFNSLMITGKNGHGKSVIVEAIHFALFGRPYRNMNIPELVNKINKEQLYTCIEFIRNSNYYKIERGIKPNFIRIYKDDMKKPLKEDVGKREFQHVINKVVGVDYKIFNQIALIDNTFHEPFMGLRARDRRHVIDRIFGLDSISAMREKYKEYKQKINNKIFECNKDIEITREKIRLNEKSNEENKKRRLDEIERDVRENRDGLKETKEELSKLNDQTNRLNEEMISLEKESKVREKVLESESSLLQEIQYEIHKFNEQIEVSKTGHCDACGQAIRNKEKRIKTLENKLLKEKEREEKQKDAVKKLRSVTESDYKSKELLRKKISEYEVKIAEVKVTRRKIRERIEQLKEKKLQVEKEYAKVDISHLNKELKEKEDAYLYARRMLTRMNTVGDILSDSGVKSFIIQEYLPVINNNLKYYLDLMEANFSFKFDSEFGEVVDSRYRDSFSYDALSSGQKARVNLAILFSFIDFAEKKNNTRLNLLILDEAIDNQGLDAAGKDAVLNILKMNINKKLLVISHSPEIKDNFDQSVEVVKNGNFSEIKWGMV